ncbi:RNase H domain-containing protein [Trichonephila clavipes]|uniref:RNase H domain-containing protein n=1 Tax=Trichonephila clavipes TaxID=2585209 RepID=A0A8X6R921_TRICX|nr:RNase H domain-containing protein [Trichonephila clavipes]
MRLMEQQTQNTVNKLVKWCDENGHNISAGRSCCVHFCRKRVLHPDPTICICETQIPVVPEVLSNTSWGADRISLIRVYQSIVLSRIDYGSVVYGSARDFMLKTLGPVHHAVLRICSGAFRTSSVQSFYVTCNQLPLNLRRKKQALTYYFKILSVPSHSLKNVNLTISMKRIYDARSHNIRPFMERTKLLLSELDLNDVDIHQRNILQFQPWNAPHFHYINPFTTYSKSDIAPVAFQRIFAYHRSRYSDYSPIYTDGSKRTDYVGCGVVMEDNVRGYRLDNCCSIFTAEAIALYRALPLIDPKHFINTVSILIFCWIPSQGNEQADIVARSATTELPITVPLCDMKRVIQHRIDNAWLESWNLQTNNKLHCVKPVIGALPVMLM